MIRNNQMKLFRILLMFILTILITNSLCYNLSITERIIIALYITSAFMVLDIYCPFVVIDEHNNKNK